MKGQRSKANTRILTARVLSDTTVSLSILFLVLVDLIDYKGGHLGQV